FDGDGVVEVTEPAQLHLDTGGSRPQLQSRLAVHTARAVVLTPLQLQRSEPVPQQVEHMRAEIGQYPTTCACLEGEARDRWPAVLDTLAPVNPPHGAELTQRQPSADPG